MIVDLQNLIDSYDGVPKKFIPSRDMLKDADKIIYKDKEFKLYHVARASIPSWAHYYEDWRMDKCKVITFIFIEENENAYYYMNGYLSGRWEEPTYIGAVEKTMSEA